MTRPHGFTLIELAIVLVIITILVGGLAVPLSAQIQARRVAETNKTLEEAKEAIIGYAISKNIPTASTCSCVYMSDGTFNDVDAPVDTSDDPDSTCPQTLCPASSDTGPVTLTVPITNHYLPCPDLSQADPEPGVDNDGVGGLADMNNGAEDRMGPYPNINNACSSTSGNFPWATLGVGVQDAWGNHLKYSVAVDTTAPLQNYGDGSRGFFRSSKGDNQVCATSTGGCPSGTVAQDVAAVVLSHGPNGLGGRTVYGVLLGPPTSADESENADGNNIFISHPPTSAAGSEFDDQVIWVSHDLLMSRVCPSGGCP